MVQVLERLYWSVAMRKTEVYSSEQLRCICGLTLAGGLLFTIGSIFFYPTIGSDTMSTLGTSMFLIGSIFYGMAAVLAFYELLVITKEVKHPGLESDRRKDFLTEQLISSDDNVDLGAKISPSPGTNGIHHEAPDDMWRYYLFEQPPRARQLISSVYVFGNVMFMAGCCLFFPSLTQRQQDGGLWLFLLGSIVSHVCGIPIIFTH